MPKTGPSPNAVKLYELLEQHPEGLPVAECGVRLGFPRSVSAQRAYSIAVNCEASGLLLAQYDGKLFAFKRVEQ